MRQERVELVHKIFGDKIGPTNHVEWIGKDWTVDFVTDSVKVLQDLLVDLHEDDLLVNGLQADVNLIIFVLWWSGPNGENHLLLNLIVGWWIRHVLRDTAVVQTEQVHEHASWVQEPSNGFPVEFKFKVTTIQI